MNISIVTFSHDYVNLKSC